jgi:hypothetical protein
VNLNAREILLLLLLVVVVVHGGYVSQTHKWTPAA